MRTRQALKASPPTTAPPRVAKAEGTMPRALVVYFSQGGTTARVARHVATGLEESGFSVHLHNLSQEAARRAAPPDPADYDLLGAGSPTHYYRLPSPVCDFLAAHAQARARADVPLRAGIPTFGFLLCGTYSGWAGRSLSEGLDAQGGACIGLYSCRGADRYVAYLRKGYLFSAGHPTALELAEAHAFGLSVGLRAQEGDTRGDPSKPAGLVPAGLDPTRPRQ
ncbi:MAG: flavodoxin family protein, partial [Thermoleophilia bacterium]